MKHLLLSSAIFFAISSTALAADAVVYEPAPAGFIWTGGYVGLHAGYGWGSVHDVSNPNATKQDIDGGFGGIQAGYNYQFSNNVVLGVEADASFGDIGATFDGRTIDENNPYYTEDKVKALGTLRARLGYAADRFMPFVTGGLAWGNTDHTLGCDSDRPILTNGCGGSGSDERFETSKSDTSVGWTAGAGAEYALAANWTLKAEYLYVDLGKNKVTLVDPFYPARSERNFETKFSTVRLGVNYKF